VRHRADTEKRFIYLACRVDGSQDFSKTWKGDPEELNGGYQTGGILKRDIRCTEETNKIYIFFDICNSLTHMVDSHLPVGMDNSTIDGIRICLYLVAKFPLL
jgi:hypothetical protein